MRLRRFESGVLIVQARGHSDEAIFAQLSQLVKTPDGAHFGISASDAARALGLPPALAKEELLAAEYRGEPSSNLCFASHLSMSAGIASEKNRSRRVGKSRIPGVLDTRQLRVLCLAVMVPRPTHHAKVCIVGIRCTCFVPKWSTRGCCGVRFNKAFIVMGSIRLGSAIFNRRSGLSKNIFVLGLFISSSGRSSEAAS